MSPFYVSRKLLNPNPLKWWMKAHDIPNPIVPEKLHTTVAFSRAPLDWENIPLDDNHVLVGCWQIIQLGEGIAFGLHDFTGELHRRHMSFRHLGASWDFDDYTPHVSLSYNALIPEAYDDFDGYLCFGPEIAEPLDLEWKDTASE